MTRELNTLVQELFLSLSIWNKHIINNIFLLQTQIVY